MLILVSILLLISVIVVFARIMMGVLVSVLVWCGIVVVSVLVLLQAHAECGGASCVGGRGG